MTCYNCQKTGHLAKNCTAGKAKIIQERELSAITARRRDILLVNVLNNKRNHATRKLNAITAIKLAIWPVLAPLEPPTVSVEDLLSVIIATKPVILRRLALVKVDLLRPEGVILPIYHAKCRKIYCI